MEPKDFAERLIEQVTMEEVDLACDVEKLLAEQVRYLRRLVEVLAEDRAPEEHRLMEQYRKRVACQETQIARLTQENRALRARLGNAPA
jgi:hypothetical protein